jgi:uncharacterized membrane protein YgcG
LIILRRGKMDKWDESQLNLNQIGWRFPSNDHGKEDGLNDAGIETFLNRPIESLTRETIQNSLDAKDHDLNRPVEVHFKLLKLSLSQFPKHKEFDEILKSCKRYWKDKKTVTFLDNAIKTIAKDGIDVLKISDFNTTGLRGSEISKDSDWSKLIKSVGSSDKAQGSGGSFGIGKHAPFACSLLRTIFYGTKDIDGKVAFQGKSILVTHTRDNDDTTQGTGYFGYTNFNKPIIGYECLPDNFQRSENGTDLFVMGFNRVSDWDTRIIKAVLEEFFVAIKNGKLIVQVEDIIINQSTIAGLIKQYSQLDPDWLAGKYFNAITSEEAAYKHVADFEGLGEVELYVLSAKNYPKRVAMVRATGMKIFDKGRFHTPMRFAGVFIAKGEKINEFLRHCEPPTHDSWIDERYTEDPVKAKYILGKLNKWVHGAVREVSNSEELEEIDAEGMSQFLPDDFNEASNDNEEKEGEQGAPVDIQLRDNYRNPRNDNNPANVPGEISNDDSDDAAADGENGGGSNEGGEPNDSDGGGAGGGGANPGGNGGQDQGGGGSGGTSTGSKNPPPTKSLKIVEIKSLRVYCIDTDSGSYRVSFEPLRNSSESILLVKILGDTEDELAPIYSAKMIGSNLDLKIISEGKIGKFDMTKGQKITLDINLSCTERCALGVSVYGHEVS